MATKVNKKNSSTDNIPTSVDSADKIERVRDLILGPQMRELSQRFEGIGKSLNHIEEELERVSSEIQSQSKKMKHDLQQLELRLNSQVKEQDTRHSEQLNTVDERLTDQIESIDQRISAKLQTMVKDLRSLEETARSELRQTADEMNQAKVDRFSLGELFAQLGEGLKSSSPGAELTSLLDVLEQEIR